MKNRYIRNEIKQEAENKTPDVLDRVKRSAKTQGLLEETTASKNERTIQTRKRTFTSMFAAIAAVFVCLAIVLPITLTSGNVPDRITMSASDAYGLGAVSTAKLLGGSVSSKAIARLSATAKKTALKTTAANDNAMQESLNRFKEYFIALDSFLGEELITTTTVKNTNDKYPYETMMTVKGKDVNGTDVAHVMYYSEQVINSEVDDDEQETEYSLVGVMVIDGVDYYLEGERTEESEKDEQESELKIRAYPDKNDKDTYIQMEQEHSVEQNEQEIEYVYSIYTNGNLVEKTAVEFETERKGSKEKAEYELEFLQGNAKGRYKLEREITNSKTQIKVKYDIDGKQGEFKIREIDNDGKKTYEYIFEN